MVKIKGRQIDVGDPIIGTCKPFVGKKGRVLSRNGEYYYVRFQGYRHEVELYECEMKKRVTVSQKKHIS